MAGRTAARSSGCRALPRCRPAAGCPATPAGRPVSRACERCSGRAERRASPGPGRRRCRRTTPGRCAHVAKSGAGAPPPDRAGARWRARLGRSAEACRDEEPCVRCPWSGRDLRRSRLGGTRAGVFAGAGASSLPSRKSRRRLPSIVRWRGQHLQWPIDGPVRIRRQPYGGNIMVGSIEPRPVANEHRFEMKDARGDRLPDNRSRPIRLVFGSASFGARPRL